MGDGERGCFSYGINTSMFVCSWDRSREKGNFDNTMKEWRLESHP